MHSLGPTIEQLDKILEDGDLTALIGLVEGFQFDAKVAPHDLNTADGRFELAKDVVAFANADGGIVICGLQTSRVATQSEELVSALSMELP